METTITLTITHKKPISDLLDKVAGRTYTLDGVDDVSATTDVGWLPIESAPKGGTTIDLWHAEFGREAECYWGLPIHSCGEAGSLCDDEFHDLEPQWINTFNSPAFPESEYTHWMPLPQPPKDQA